MNEKIGNWGIGLVIIGVFFLSGCVSAPLKQYSEVLPKANNIRLEKAVFCKLGPGEGGYKLSFGEPINNPSAEQLEVVEVYEDCLKKELEKRGFTVTADSGKEGTVIVKTKIGEIPSTLIAVGAAGVEIEVRDSNDKLLLSFQRAANTSVLVSAKWQMKRFIASQVAEQLKKKFL